MIPRSYRYSLLETSKHESKINDWAETGLEEWGPALVSMFSVNTEFHGGDGRSFDESVTQNRRNM